MIAMRPVLEMNTPDGFGLWPVVETERFGFLPLGGDLSPAEVGTALMRIAACNDVDPADHGPAGRTDAAEHQVPPGRKGSRDTSP